MNKPFKRLQISGLTVDFGEIRALDNIHLSVDAGAAVLVYGENGAGKSTFLWSVAGLLLPTAGRITFFMDNGSKPSIGFLSHQSFLYEDLTVLENLLLASRLYGLNNPIAHAGEWMERVGLANQSSKRVSTLSRGQIQRAAFARAALTQPDVLLLDEPFSNLDAPGIDALSTILNEIRTADRIILMASHHAKDYEKISTQTIEIRGGKVHP